MRPGSRFFTLAVLLFAGFPPVLHGQESDSVLAAVLAAVPSWELPDRDLVLASLGESGGPSRGLWRGEEALPFGSDLAAFDALPLPTGVEITWITTREFGTGRFAIERRLPDGRFAIITTMEAAGVSKGLQVYRFLDRRVDGIPQTYRLRQFDQNGTQHISQPVEVFPAVDQLAVLSPQLNDHLIQLPLESPVVKVNVWNENGKLIFSLESWEEGIQQIPVSDWQSGRYALQMETEAGTRTALISLP